MPDKTLSLRHFVIGKFLRSPRDDYHILALHPAHERNIFDAVHVAIEPILSVVTTGHTTHDVRLIVPSSLGAIYIRQFASTPLDPANRPVSRAHVVLLDTDSLEALAWRPWALDPWLASGIGRDRLIGPGAMEKKVDPDHGLVELPIDVPCSMLSEPAPLAAEATAQVGRGVECLEKLWSLCIREERTSPDDALELIAALLAERCGDVGVAIDVPPGVPWHEQLVQRAGLRIAYLRSGVGRAPDHWLELVRVHDVPASTYGGALPRPLDVPHASRVTPAPVRASAAPRSTVAASPPPVATEPSPPVATNAPVPIATEAPMRVATEPSAPIAVVAPQSVPSEPPRPFRAPPPIDPTPVTVRHPDSPRYGMWLLGILLGVSVIGNISQKLSATATVNQLARDAMTARVQHEEELSKAGETIAALRASVARAETNAKQSAGLEITKAKNEAEKARNEAASARSDARNARDLANSRGVTLRAWEYAAGYLAENLSDRNWSSLVAAIEKQPADKPAIERVLSDYKQKHKPRPDLPRQ